jgi:hypothetical protein
MRQVTDHFIFVLEAAVQRFELFQFSQVQRRKAVHPHAAKVTPGSFDPQHSLLVAGQGIGHVDFCRRVATAKVGDAQIRAQQIGAIPQLLGLAHRCSRAVVPFVLEFSRCSLTHVPLWLGMNHGGILINNNHYT